LIFVRRLLRLIFCHGIHGKHGKLLNFVEMVNEPVCLSTDSHRFSQIIVEKINPQISQMAQIFLD